MTLLLPGQKPGYEVGLVTEFSTKHPRIVFPSGRPDMYMTKYIDTCFTDNGREDICKLTEQVVGFVTKRIGITKRFTLTLGSQQTEGSYGLTSFETAESGAGVPSVRVSPLQQLFVWNGTTAPDMLLSKSDPISTLAALLASFSEKQGRKPKTVVESDSPFYWWYVSVIAHELVHVKQMLDGRLLTHLYVKEGVDPNKRGLIASGEGYVYTEWEGSQHKPPSPVVQSDEQKEEYTHQPWEAEAWAQQYPLAYEFLATDAGRSWEDKLGNDELFAKLPPVTWTGKEVVDLAVLTA